MVSSSGSDIAGHGDRETVERASGDVVGPDPDSRSKTEP